MRKKILNNDNILRMVYESYKRVLKEVGEQPNIQPQQYSSEPLDFSTSEYKGNIYFSVTFRDLATMNKFKNFGTEMANKAKMSAERNGTSFTEKNFNEFKAMYRPKTSNGKLDKETEWMIISFPLSDPKSMVNEDGSINLESEDTRKILLFLKDISQRGVRITKPEIKNAVLSAVAYVSNKIDDDGKLNIERGVQELFFEICQKIGTEETKQLLRTIQIGEEGVLVDSQFDLQNKLRIIAQAIEYDKNGDNQAKTISYLETERQWRKHGRQVVDFSHPYHAIVFHGGRGNQDKEAEYAASLGYKPMTNENKWNGIGFAAGKALNKKVNKAMYGRNGFGWHTFYDVQATRVIPGYQDKWTEEPGMKNNLTGEYNDVALEKLGLMNPEISKERGERTEKLNNIFNTGDYNAVSLIYQATCMAAKEKPNLLNNGDTKQMIKKTGEIIDEMLIKRLQGFKDGEGHIALSKNYMPLIPIGRIIIQATIGLPMDDAPALQWAEEHKQIVNALSNHVFAISHAILNNKKQLIEQNRGEMSMNEKIELFEPILTFENTFNKNLNLIKENAEK